MPRPNHPRWVRHSDAPRARCGSRNLALGGFRSGPAAPWVWTLDERLVRTAIRQHFAREIRQAERELEALTVAAAAAAVIEAESLLKDAQ